LIQTARPEPPAPVVLSGRAIVSLTPDTPTTTAAISERRARHAREVRSTWEALWQLGLADSAGVDYGLRRGPDGRVASLRDPDVANCGTRTVPDQSLQRAETVHLARLLLRSGPSRTGESYGDEALVRYGTVLAPARLSFPLATRLIGTPGINGKEACDSEGAGVCPPPS
jgi:hypothetical protein